MNPTDHQVQMIVNVSQSLPFDIERFRAAVTAILSSGCELVGYVSEYTADTLQEARARGHGEVKQIASKPARSVVVPVYRRAP